MSDLDLSQRKIYTTIPNQNNYVTISSVVASQIPLANVFNGVPTLLDIVNQITMQANTDPKAIQYGVINRVLDFKMYKFVKPKVIFSAYYSRVIPDSSQSNVSAQQYYPVVVFKIDYDACCVGAMMCVLTVDISVRQTIGSLTINGLTANGNTKGIVLDREKDVKSIQYSFCNDFLYHYIDKVSIGFANTGGNAPVWHQEIPIQIIKIHHSLLVDPGMAETIKRAVREDNFIIGHDAHRQFGDFSFQVKTPAAIAANTTVTSAAGGRGPSFNFNQRIQSSQTDYSSSNEIAMYWNDTQIKEFGFGGLSNTNSYSNPNNIQISFDQQKMTGSSFKVDIQSDKNNTKQITGVQMGTELYWRLGSETSTIKIVIGGESFSIGSSSAIPIISSLDGPVVPNSCVNLPSILAGIQDGLYPKYTKTLDVANKENLYVVPFIKYTTTSINFGVALISQLVGTVTYGRTISAAPSAVVLSNDKLISSLSQTIAVQVSDQKYTGGMTYNMNQAYVNDNDDVQAIYMIAEYPLSISDNGFISQPIYNTSVGTKTSIAPAGAFTPQNSGAGFLNCIVSQVGGMNSQIVALGDFTSEVASTMGAYLLQSTGAMSPLMQQANLAYVNIVTKPYDQNDLMLNSLQWYTQSNGAVLLPQGSDKYAVFRYNAAIASNGQTEENYPCIQNVDDMSIHTYKKSHGVVDFHFPMGFFFICQDIASSFPHYACAAQSILVKFEFNNPLAFINTSISVRPQAVDPMDFGHNERVFVNRVSTRDILQSSTQNMKFVLYYVRYAWMPQLIPILAGYKYYSWVTNNYERFYKLMDNLSSNSQYTVCQFNKANFYTHIWMFVTNRETLEILNNRGAQLDYMPISVNSYKLELWDKLRYQTGNNITSQGLNIAGSTDDTTIAQQNSVYYQVPFDSVQLVTKTSINMTDEIPYRTQMLLPYLMLEHQMLHNKLEFNNLLQFNIDPVFYQEGFPNCMYSPAYAPDFELRITTKNGQQQDFGTIIIPQYKNVSYITSHVILLKYSTNN